jgi:hypothetical protein
MTSGPGTLCSGPPAYPLLTPAGWSSTQLERPVFEVSPQRLARPQHLLYAQTMEYSSGVAFRYSDSGTEGSRWHAHSVGNA